MKAREQVLLGLLRLAAIIAGLNGSLASASADDPSLPRIATLEQSGQWSEIVDHLRGRLIAEPFRDSAGKSSVRIYLELQNPSFQPAGIRLTIRRWDALKWTLVDGRGNPMPAYEGPLPFILDFAAISYPITLPPDSRLRFLFASGSYDTLAPSGVRIFYFVGPERMWQMAGDRSAKYYLGAVFKVPASEAGSWSGTLTLPKVALPIPPWNDK